VLYFPCRYSPFFTLFSPRCFLVSDAYFRAPLCAGLKRRLCDLVTAVFVLRAIPSVNFLWRSPFALLPCFPGSCAVANQLFWASLSFFLLIPSIWAVCLTTLAGECGRTRVFRCMGRTCPKTVIPAVVFHAKRVGLALHPACSFLLDPGTDHSVLVVVPSTRMRLTV